MLAAPVGRAVRQAIGARACREPAPKLDRRGWRLPPARVGKARSHFRALCGAGRVVPAALLQPQTQVPNILVVGGEPKRPLRGLDRGRVSTEARLHLRTAEQIVCVVGELREQSVELYERGVRRAGACE